MKTIAIRILLVFIVITPLVTSSCRNGGKDKARPRKAQSLEERVAALEKKQDELLAEIKIMRLREKRQTRAIRKLRAEKSYLEELESTLSKDVKEANAKIRALARVTNKLIDYTNRKADELKSMKRKFYKLYRATMGRGKTFTEPATVQKPEKIAPTVPPTKESEKSRKLKKKIQEGMV